MRTFNRQAAQGDVLFRKVSELPADITAAKDKVVAHSETGHHHSFDVEANVFLYSTKDQLVSYLDVKEDSVLKHRRSFDTHEELLFKPGLYEIRRQREWTPEGWKRVED